MNSLELTRLEKAAADCGFDLTPQTIGEALVLRSTKFPEEVLVSCGEGEVFYINTSSELLLPLAKQDGACVVSGWQDLYTVLQSASNIARTLPDRIVQQFANATTSLPRGTEAERLVVQRVGQQFFRDALISFWQGRCCISGLDLPEMLRASHIRPWAACESDEQRLDVYNGLLLSANWDAAFDAGLVTVGKNGFILASTKLNEIARDVLCWSSSLQLKLHPKHEMYLDWHRDHVFQG